MLNHTRDVFVHTFCDSQIDMEDFGMFDSPVRRARVDIDKMIYADLCYSSEVSAPQYLRGLKDDLENDRLIPNRFASSCISSAQKSQFIQEGNQYIKRLTAYLEEKVFEDGDIEFDTEYE